MVLYYNINDNLKLYQKDDLNLLNYQSIKYIKEKMKKKGKKGKKGNFVKICQKKDRQRFRFI